MQKQVCVFLQYLLLDLGVRAGLVICYISGYKHSFVCMVALGDLVDAIL